MKRLRAQARIEYVGEFAAKADAKPAAQAQEADSAKDFERAVRALR